MTILKCCAVNSLHILTTATYIGLQNEGYKSTQALPTSKCTHCMNTFPVTQSTGYDFVRCQLVKITGLLRARKPAYEALTLHCKQEGWLEMTGNPTEDELVTLALVKIKNDSRQYDTFLNMLRAIEGLDEIVNAITCGYGKFLSIHIVIVPMHMHGCAWLQLLCHH